MKTLSAEKEKAFSKSYDYITNVFTKQGRVVPLKDVYGDGSIHKGLTKDEFAVLYNSMIEAVDKPCNLDYYGVRAGGCVHGETTPRGWIHCTNANCTSKS